METIALPKNIQIKKESSNQATLTIEPCYPGYGTTIGNALRRVLLSSLPGAAVTAVKVKDVEHEFSTIAQVKEDVISIILNLKNIRFRVHAEEPIKLSLKAKGEKIVRASDIKTTADVEIINPQQVIATLTDKSAG
jgi:DNA-directed RNA polymerase subunit alpha